MVNLSEVLLQCTLSQAMQPLSNTLQFYKYANTPQHICPNTFSITTYKQIMINFLRSIIMKADIKCTEKKKNASNNVVISY